MERFAPLCLALAAALVYGAYNSLLPEEKPADPYAGCKMHPQIETRDCRDRINDALAVGQ